MKKAPDKTPEVLVSVSSLATLLHADVAWLGAWLEKNGVTVDAQGQFPPQPLLRVFGRQMASALSPATVDFETKAAMGNTTETGRQWLIREFPKNGMEVTGRSGKSGSKFAVWRKATDGKLWWIATYVSKTMKTSGTQVGFVAGPDDDDGRPFDWYAFVALPMGKAYLRSRKDLETRWRKKHGNTPMGRMTVTFSAGLDTDLFENRIEELV